MQNLPRCVNRQYIISGRIFRPLFNYNATNYEKTTSIAFNNAMNRLCFPVSYHTYKQVLKELNCLRSLLLQNGTGRSYCLPKWCNTRSFHATSSGRKDTGRESGQGSNNSEKGPDDPDKERVLMVLKLCLFSMVLTLASAYLVSSTVTDKNIQTIQTVSWNEFVYHMLAKGEVKEVIIHQVSDTQGRVVVVVHDGAIIKGRRSILKHYNLNLSDFKNVEQRIRHAEEELGIKFGDRVAINYERISETPRIIAGLGMVILMLYVMRFLFTKSNLMNPLGFMSQMKTAKYTLVEPFSSKGVRFEDVAGLKEAKIEVMEFVDYLKNPERYKTLGAKIPKGALLLGPPGCGKTLLAKAVATESNVPFLSMNGSEFIEMLGGLGAARVRNLFKEAKQRAPSIIYIDEIDAIGKKRSEGPSAPGNSETDLTLNQLLVEMDGMTTTADLIILASTNRAEVLDKALLRPGRFDRHILIDLPTLEERKQIFESHLKVLSLDDKPSKYSGYLSYLTPGFSGADIASVCNEGALHAARVKKTKVDGSDLMYAIDKIIGGLTKKTNTITPSTKRVVAYHEAGHALVGWLMQHTDALLKVTIVPRTNLSLGFAQYSESDQKLYTKEQLFERMCMMLGGRVGEYVTFGKISTGAENDLKKVTQSAYHQVQQFGMSPAIGLISFDPEYTSTKTKKPYSKKLANLMDAEVRRMIGEAYQKTEKLLNDNKDKLTMLAEALLERETLTYDDVEKLIGPPPFGKKRPIDPAVFEKPVVDAEPIPSESTT